MSDIIKDAKQLLDGATPGPWEVDIDGLEVYSTVDGDAVAHAQTPSDADLIAAAPELAQVLAEETWEYSYQILRRDEWEHASDRIPGVDEWFPSKYVADFIMDAAQKSGYVCRLVRRRVSPVEVVNDNRFTR